MNQPLQILFHEIPVNNYMYIYVHVYTVMKTTLHSSISIYIYICVYAYVNVYQYQYKYKYKYLYTHSILFRAPCCRVYQVYRFKAPQKTTRRPELLGFTFDLLESGAENHLEVNH